MNLFIYVILTILTAELILNIEYLRGKNLNKGIL